MGGVVDLDISHTLVTSVSWVAGGNVRKLKLCCTPVRDVAPLGELDHVDLTGCRLVTQVDALRDVGYLSIQGCPVEDVSMMRNQTLDLRDTAVVDNRCMPVGYLVGDRIIHPTA